MNSYEEKARENFLKGYNCAQAVLVAFCDRTGLDEETSARLAAGFGGGFARNREVCGAVSGAVQVLGTAFGNTDPGDQEGKKKTYEVVNVFLDRFREENGSIICRELLAGVQTTQGKIPEQRSQEYYKKRPCKEIVAIAAILVEETLRKYGK